MVVVGIRGCVGRVLIRGLCCFGRGLFPAGDLGLFQEDEPDVDAVLLALGAR